MATLMRSNQVRLVWTTSFDMLIADAYASIFGPAGNLTAMSLDAPEHGLSMMKNGLWKSSYIGTSDLEGSRVLRRNFNDKASL